MENMLKSLSAGNEQRDYIVTRQAASFNSGVLKTILLCGNNFENTYTYRIRFCEIRVVNCMCNIRYLLQYPLVKIRKRFAKGILSGASIRIIRHSEHKVKKGYLLSMHRVQNVLEAICKLRKKVPQVELIYIITNIDARILTFTEIIEREVLKNESCFVFIDH